MLNAYYICLIMLIINAYYICLIFENTFLFDQNKGTFKYSRKHFINI